MESKVSLLTSNTTPSRYQFLNSLNLADSWPRVGVLLSAIFGGKREPVRKINVHFNYVLEGEIPAKTIKLLDNTIILCDGRIKYIQLHSPLHLL